MTHQDSAAHQNQVHQSLVPMLRVWTRSIALTIILSAVLAVLFALICDGCSGLR